jgi:hypothetical protein
VCPRSDTPALRYTAGVARNYENFAAFALRFRFPARAKLSKLRKNPHRRFLHFIRDIPEN